MTKSEIIQCIIHNLKQDLSQATLAAEEAHKGATHEQSKAETQYDTIGLEHAYLAEGQSRRIDKLAAEITRLDNWSAPDFNNDDDIYLGALVQLTDINSNRCFSVFLAPAGGGQKVDSLDLQIISPDTPLAASMLGRGVEDTVKLPNGLTYKIISIR